MTYQVSAVRNLGNSRKLRSEVNGIHCEAVGFVTSQKESLSLSTKSNSSFVDSPGKKDMCDKLDNFHYK